MKSTIQILSAVLFLAKTVLCNELSPREIQSIQYELNHFKIEQSHELLDELKRNSELLQPFITEREEAIESYFKTRAEEIRKRFSCDVNEDILFKIFEEECLEEAVMKYTELINSLKEKLGIEENTLENVYREELKNDLLERNKNETESTIKFLDILSKISIEMILQNKKVIDDVRTVIECAKATNEFQEYQKDRNRTNENNLAWKIKEHAWAMQDYDSNLASDYRERFRESKADEYIEKLAHIQMMQDYFMICFKAIQKDHFDMMEPGRIDFLFSHYTPGIYC